MGVYAHAANVLVASPPDAPRHVLGERKQLCVVPEPAEDTTGSGFEWNLPYIMAIISRRRALMALKQVLTAHVHAMNGA